MRAYSTDLRERIVTAVEEGMPKSHAARVFGVSESSVQRYVRLAGDGGDLTPKPLPGRQPLIGPEEYPALAAQLAAQPDATLAEHCRLWAAEHGVSLDLSTMARTIQRLGWTRKKRP